ncbi:MAG: hypothetical protein Unbinned338contig1000_14 [Prokaryotic dsDNA virus sp.]|nr:MAG: hypothetical protein Unbinned338contig1000_14 [Prokaryotic dsDNA virus sp.]|tara:strand:- start:3996 stop:4148 length:153 start_codon:yes stop_codon:yes gene_type:complete
MTHTDRIHYLAHGVTTAVLVFGLLWQAPQIARAAHLYATGAVSPANVTAN